MSFNYINNEELYRAMVEWKMSGNKTMPDNVAKAILQICNNLARSGKFAGYTWKDEMIQDAIFVCTKFAYNFNTDKYNNPFAYFTQIAYNAFRRRINVERNKLATIEKYKYVVDNIYELDNEDDSYDFIDNNAKIYNNNLQKSYIKEKKKKINKIDELFEGTN